MDQQQTRENDKHDKQDSYAGSDGADEVSQRLYIGNQFRMLRSSAFHSFSQAHNLLFHSLHPNGLVLHLEHHFTVIGLNLGKPLVQLIVHRVLSRFVTVGQVNQMGNRLHSTVIDHAQPSSEDGKQRLEL